MRLLLLAVALVACEPPPPKPVQQPRDPDGVENCRSSPTQFGGVRYDCGSYEVFDSIGDPISIHSLERHLEKLASAKSIESTSRSTDVDGAVDAVAIDYRQAGKFALDLVATRPVEAKLRVLQCHVPWFEDARSIQTRSASCAHTIALVLQKPPPAGREISETCNQAVTQIQTLPGHPDAIDEMRADLRDFLARCTDQVAACGLGARSYVEATLCR